ncbi:MAG: aminotransferase class I/II-fold pyridoxal phosphate-dependent enzyme [Rhizobiales bacterium]|nr:aminotransferase class I/II-fold pyridoxal phosphate-dependent enzyme [Hyphomicrobiales bacterium]
MSDQLTPASLAIGLPRSPFERLRELIATTPPGAEPIDLSIGAPRHPFPQIVAETLAKEIQGFGRYPPAHADNDFGAAASDWLARRFGLTPAPDPKTHILPIAGSREGLFTIAFIAATRAREQGRTAPAIALPNPFYPVYAAAALAAGAEPIALPATAATGELPDFSTLPGELLDRLAAVYICSPANPQGAIAGLSYLQELCALAIRHDFLVISDECYSELYRSTPPPSILNASRGSEFTNVLAFNSLSKRSNVPGLRAGLVAGDPALIKSFFSFRNVIAATVPLPVMAVAAALWRDEEHVQTNRALYNVKFERAGEILGNRFGHTTPPGGFFLWLDVSEYGGSETAAKRLWSEAGIKVVPGAYLAADQSDGFNPGAAHLRVALVGELNEVEHALTRLVGIFN